MSAEKSNTTNTGIVLLAAGASTRLGRPKQLLLYQGQSFLQYSLQTALASNAETVVVVLGANADTLQQEINNTNANVVVNENWQEGMSSSIRSGIKAFTESSPSAEGVILMVCDQPFVTTSLLNDLIIAHQKSRKTIVASGYDDTFGPPVYFHRSLFKELLQLKGDVGARSIIRQHTDEVDVVPFPEGKYDVDTEADYEKLKESNND